MDKQRAKAERHFSKTEAKVWRRAVARACVWCCKTAVTGQEEESHARTHTRTHAPTSHPQADQTPASR
jgi:hypothetical protein